MTELHSAWVFGNASIRRSVAFAAAGLAFGLIYTASPLGLWVLALVAVVWGAACSGLPAHERRVLTGVLCIALAARMALLIALFLAGASEHNDLAVGPLSGDEQYNLGRALRARDILLGFGATKYDYFVSLDEYGRSSYLQLLTALQIVFGPTPYSARALNSVLFVGGAVLLYRQARSSYGSSAALAGLAGLLALPSLIVTSTSLLKESVYFLLSALLLVGTVQALRGERWSRTAAAAAATVASLWLLDDLRRGASALALAGLGLALGAYLTFKTTRRALVALCLAAAGVALVWYTPALRARTLQGVEAAAKAHTGHVFTVGHAYKLLDDGFYRNPQTPAASTLTLTEVQAGRFIARGVASFVLTPLPWQVSSRRELLVLPEHLIWYVMLALLPAGLYAGWRRDRAWTAVLIGYALPTAVALALTNGNVGTIVRLRGLVTPYLIWLSAVGAHALIVWALSSGRSHAPMHMAEAER